MLALIMVGTAALGAGAACWATQAEEESIILKQRLVVGRFQEVAVWAQYAHQYATWTVLRNDSIDRKNLGLRLSRTADGIREADPAEAARLDLQAQEEFAHARIYETFHHFLKRPDAKLSIDEALTRDVSAELARYGFGVSEEAPQAVSRNSQAATEGSTRNELKFWQFLDDSISQAHRRVLLFSLAVVLYVSALVLFTFADLNQHLFRRACAFAGAGFCIVIATVSFSIWVDASFLILVGTICLVAVPVVLFASTRGLFRSDVSEGEPLHAHEVENKSYWGASLFLRHSHDARSRLGITLIAMSVLLSSGVGYLYVEASTTREELSHQALKYEVAFGTNSTASAAIAMAGGLQPTINLLAKQFHCAAATQQEMFPRKGAEKHVSEFGGVGVEIEKDGETRVISVREDGSAAQAGVRAGDVITHIDGESIAAMPLYVVVNRLRGRIGAAVGLRISRDNAASAIELTVTRRKITGEATVAENSEALVLNRRVACEELNSERSIQQQQDIQRADYDSGYTPGQNLYYRAVYLSGRGNPAGLYARADGYEELAGLWNSKATVYLANLTLFAIALYLFGQALGVGSAWQTNTFLGFGTLLITLSAGWALVTWARSPEGRPDIPARCMDGIHVDAHSPSERFVEIAAHHYGQGEALFSLAESPAVYRKAADALDCAVAARPNFGRAHSLRSSAYEFMDSTTRPDTYLPASSWSRTRDIIAARRQALRAFQSNNVAPSWIVSSNAFDELVLALMDGDRAALASAGRVFAAQVISKEKRERKGADDRAGPGTSDPDLYMNYGLTLLADNRPTEAEAIYRHAISDLRVAQDKRLVVDALTDLRMLATNCTRLQSAQTCAGLTGSVRKIKESLVAAEWHDKQIDRPSLSDVSIQITPYSAGWRAKLDATAVSEQHKITVVWYMLDAASGDGRPEGKMLWRAIRGLTQTIDVASLKPNADGTVESVIPYLKEQSVCLAEGTYVPEVYIDGLLVSPDDLPAASLKRFETYRSRYLNLVMCHPAGWKIAAGSWAIPMRMLMDAQKQESALLFTFYAPRATSSDELRTEYLVAALKYLFGIFPKAPSEQVIWNMTAGVAAFRGCNETVPKGAVPHREWITPEGFVNVALVFPWIPVEDACQVLNSIDNYFEPNSPPAKK